MMSVVSLHHSIKLAEQLYEQFLCQSQECDVVIVAGNMEFKAHRCVLACSPFYQCAFRSDMLEGKTGRVKVNYGSASAVRLSTEYLYRGSVKINEQNVKELLPMANFLLIPELKSSCEKFITSIEKTHDNCLELLFLTGLYDLDMYHNIYHYVCTNFEKILKNELILTVDKESLMFFIKEIDLNYVPSDIFLDFVIRWVEHDIGNRHGCFSELFDSLDIASLTKGGASHGISSPLVQQFDSCRKVLAKIESGEETTHKGKLYIFFSHILFHKQTSSQFENFVFEINKQGWLKWEDNRPRHSQIFVDASNNIFSYEMLQDQIYIQEYDNKRPTTKLVAPSGSKDLCWKEIVRLQNGMYLLGTKGNSFFIFEITGDKVKAEVSIKSELIGLYLMCYYQQRFLCILSHNVGGENVFIVYDSLRNIIKCFTEKQKERNILFSTDDSVLCVDIASGAAHQFNFAKPGWDESEAFSVPPIPENSLRQNYAYAYHNRELYIFGGIYRKETKIDSVFKVNFDSKTWIRLSDIPYCIDSFRAGVARANFVTPLCSFRCPHCEVKMRSSLVEIFMFDDSDENDYSEESDYDYYYDDSNRWIIDDSDDDYNLW